MEAPQAPLDPPAAPAEPLVDSLSSAADLLGGLSIDSEESDSGSEADALLESAASNLDLLAPLPTEGDAEVEAPASHESDPLAATEGDAHADESDSGEAGPISESDDVEDTTYDGVEHAGAGIRSLEVVDMIPGDKLEGSLHETETTTLSVGGEVVSQNVDGVLTISNPSEKDRLWDIDIFMNNLTATDVEDGHILIQELEAGSDNTRDYSVSGPNMLTVREIIDTQPDRDKAVSTSAVCSEDAQIITIRIEVENVGPVPLYDVEVNRTIPSQLTIAEGELHTQNKNGLHWVVGEITPGGVRKLELTAELLTETVDEVAAGSTTATYRAEATLSGMSIHELDAYCRGFSYMEVDEDERPDNWKCKAIFENRSSFAVDLVKLQVKQAGAEEYLFDKSDVEKDVKPDGRWESEIAIVAATEEPNLNQDMNFTVIPRVTHSTDGTLELEQYTISILEAEVDKNYSAEVLRTYREATVNAEIVIKNSGTATINLMRLTDDVPGIFNSPDLEQVQCTIDDNELIREQFGIDVREGVTLEDTAVSPDGPGHTMLITIGKKGPIGLEPGQTMKITYPLVAPDPTPDNDTVAAPLKVDFSAERYGPVAVRTVAEPPAIRIIHKRRKFDTGKEVFPAGGAGRYEVLIMFKNRSDSALQDLIIHDVVPAAFEIKGYNIRSDSGVREAEMEKADDENGVKVSWHIPVIEKDERIEVIYELVGDSGAEYKVSEAKDFRGATFGDELDIDLPPAPPEAIEEEEDIEEADVEDDDVSEETTDDDDSSGDDDDVSEETADEDDSEAVTGDDDEDGSAEEGDTDEGDDSDEDDSDEEEVSEVAEAASAEDEVDDGQSESDGEGPDEESEIDAALAQITGGSSSVEAEEAAVDDGEIEGEEVVDGRTCPICSSSNDQGANVCSTCSFEFE